ncbi:methyltransferase [Vallitalea longa]|uniref:Methyltransferase n=1 Tax=Vallitalea longa TaxID=2936439 RepID=A0A9W5YER1_9FIRM|nr:class I SAM-dependent methyltransferase [Vallitalea longa]GKX32157.1 methyltransferase [Vallitalea longa]
MEYFGFCKGISQMNMPDTIYSDMYEGYYAKFYDSLVKNDDFDIDFYQELSEEYGKEVLELACGSGRVLIPLLKRGLQIHGVDLSTHMIDILKAKCKKKNLTPEIYFGDMCTFKCNKKFDMVILSHISISLLESHQQRVQLFNNVYKFLLKEGGIFVFNFVDYSKKMHSSGELKPNYYFNPSKKAYTILFEKVDLELQKVFVNLYSEEVDSTGGIKRFVGSSCKNIITKESIDEILTDIGFTVVKEKNISTQEGLIKFYVLKK